ncbi:hypothetical protein Droror1_Dr00005722 [Drosera rotundifolia]
MGEVVDGDGELAFWVLLLVVFGVRCVVGGLSSCCSIDSLVAEDPAAAGSNVQNRAAQKPSRLLFSFLWDSAAFGLHLDQHRKPPPSSWSSAKVSAAAIFLVFSQPQPP